MADRLPIMYWDTCMFLEHLRQEEVDATRRRASLRILQDNKDQKNRIVTSTLTHAEAIPKKITAADVAAEEKYWSYFNGIYFLDQDISRPIIQVARSIRDYYFLEGDPKAAKSYRMLGLADAIHLATAIVADVDEFHTRDKKGRGGNIGLMELSRLIGKGMVAERWQLTIIDPQDPQGDMLDSLKA